MEDQWVPLTEGATFVFSCTPDVSCFNACCRDLNQYLTPYDILCLKRFLGLSSGDFLERYTVCYDGPRTGLPVVSLRPAGGLQKRCPFVTDRGCAVYAARPSSCRTYPLARAVGISPDTGKLTAQYALLKETHCKGHDAGRRWTVADWIADQQLAVCHAVNDRFLPIIHAKNRYGSGPLALPAKRLFQMALYDVDAFREQIKRPGFLGENPPDGDRLKRLAADDRLLLEFAHAWIVQTLFQGPGS